MRHPYRNAVCLAFVFLCADCTGFTGGSYVQLPVSVRAQAPGPEATTAGWTVTLTRAELNLGPLHFYEGEPLFADWAGDAMSLVFGGREALAHPGHYEAGAAEAELLQPQVVDLLTGGAVALGDADGVTGSYRSAKLELGTTETLAGAVLIIEGRAERGTESIPFSATVVDPMTIEGIAVGAEVNGPAEVILTVDLGAWVDRIDFSSVPASGTLEPESQPHNALLRGVSNTSAYTFSVTDLPVVTE